MGFFEILGILLFVYFLINVILWCVLDSDIQLFLKDKFGLPISSLQGKVVWVTGASSGIGKELAIVLAKNGVKLCISARREAELEAVKKECLYKNSKLSPKDILVLKMDMLDIENHQSSFDKVLQHFGQIDVLVNNAGRSQRAEWQKITLDVDRELFDLDVFSVINLTRVYVRYVEKSGIQGHVAVTSSILGITAVPGSGSYTGAKHAIHGYFETLRVELPKTDVTLFCPGPTTTEFLEHAFTENAGDKYQGKALTSGKRMSAERCAYLMAVSIANKLHLSYVGIFPVMIFTYIALYCPNLKYLLWMVLGKSKTLQKIRDPEKKFE